MPYNASPPVPNEDDFGLPKDEELDRWIYDLFVLGTGDEELAGEYTITIAASVKREWEEQKKAGKKRAGGKKAKSSAATAPSMVDELQERGLGDRYFVSKNINKAYRVHEYALHSLQRYLLDQVKLWREKQQEFDRDAILIWYVLHIMKLAFYRNSVYIAVGMLRFLSEYRYDDISEVLGQLGAKKVHELHNLRRVRETILDSLEPQNDPEQEEELPSFINLSKSPTSGRRSLQMIPASAENARLMMELMTRMTLALPKCCEIKKYDRYSYDLSASLPEYARSDAVDMVEWVRMHSMSHPVCLGNILESLVLKQWADNILVPEIPEPPDGGGSSGGRGPSGGGGPSGGQMPPSTGGRFGQLTPQRKEDIRRRRMARGNFIPRATNNLRTVELVYGCAKPVVIPLNRRKEVKLSLRPGDSVIEVADHDFISSPGARVRPPLGIQFVNWEDPDKREVYKTKLRGHGRLKFTVTYQYDEGYPSGATVWVTFTPSRVRLLVKAAAAAVAVLSVLTLIYTGLRGPQPAAAMVAKSLMVMATAGIVATFIPFLVARLKVTLGGALNWVRVGALAAALAAPMSLILPLMQRAVTGGRVAGQSEGEKTIGLTPDAGSADTAHLPGAHAAGQDGHEGVTGQSASANDNSTGGSQPPIFATASKRWPGGTEGGESSTEKRREATSAPDARERKLSTAPSPTPIYEWTREPERGATAGWQPKPHADATPTPDAREATQATNRSASAHAPTVFSAPSPGSNPRPTVSPLLVMPGKETGSFTLSRREGAVPLKIYDRFWDGGGDMMQPSRRIVNGRTANPSLGPVLDSILRAPLPSFTRGAWRPGGESASQTELAARDPLPYLRAYEVVLPVVSPGAPDTPLKGGRIRGKLYDPEGEGVAQATLLVKDLVSGETLPAITSDNGGQFSFINLRPGTYELTVKKEGFDKVSVENAKVNDDLILHLDILLREPPAGVERTRAQEAAAFEQPAPTPAEPSHAASAAANASGQTEHVAHVASEVARVTPERRGASQWSEKSRVYRRESRPRMAAGYGQAGGADRGEELLAVKEGQLVSVRLLGEIGSARSRVGDRFVTTVIDPVFSDGAEIIPEGSRIVGRVSGVKPASAQNARGVLEVEFSELHLPRAVRRIDAVLTDATRADVQAGRAPRHPEKQRVTFVGGTEAEPATSIRPGATAGEGKPAAADSRDALVRPGTEFYIAFRQKIILTPSELRLTPSAR